MWGRDVEQIVRDLIEIAISMEKVKKERSLRSSSKACRRKSIRCASW